LGRFWGSFEHVLGGFVAEFRLGLAAQAGGISATPRDYMAFLETFVR
jgi:hypothetical protein